MIKLTKGRKVDCCKLGRDNIKVMGGKRFKWSMLAPGLRWLSIGYCPFCGIPVPDVWKGTLVEDYKEFEDYIILSKGCTGPRKANAPQAYQDLEDDIVGEDRCLSENIRLALKDEYAAAVRDHLAKVQTRPTCNNGETALYVTDVGGFSMGCDVMPNKCSICESNKCLYYNDLASEEWSEHVE